ncbi:phage tail assembly protein [Serratia sp. P2ACOL2]|uniref:phage tail assembly protein n=1 Tax=Serratia sp. P2ACOL2 TaxID=2482769 RepID=UPI000EFC932D|nr:phage tail assembly protein [Serratia sp. P2ACOL2]AYO37236.1 phage tail assembly protein [Serratia sp. P2ACOL2]AYO37344.1 phage tail assembly protein [Serratia sp. P2ACOL2]
MNYPGQKEEIKFYTPLTLKDGSQLTSVYMREPLLRDRLDYSKNPGNAVEKDAGMMANLCDMNIEDMYLLTAADYAQVEAAFNRFLLPPDERQKAKSKKR